MTNTFSKTVAIKAVDEDERTATGAVLVPNEVDRQRDFLRPEGIERMFAADPDDGVMHSAFPDGAAELVRNEIVDDELELNGETYPPGTWVATRKYYDDALWQLVADGVLEGFSIGGQISEERNYAADSVPDDVRFPAPVDDGPATELVDGSVQEVSDVDIPAVPRATYRELSKLGKSITEQVDGREEFVALMQERGHDREDATQLWRYLQRNKTKSANESEELMTEKAEYSTDEWVSWQAAGGRANGQIVDVSNDGTYDDEISGDVTVTGTEDDPAYLIEVWQGTGDDASPIEEESGRGDTLHVAHLESTLRRVDDPREVETSKSGIIASLKSLVGDGDADDPDAGEDYGTQKAGRTLSQTNRRAVMASIDAQLGMLDDAGVDHGMQRFSDREDFAFTLADYEGKGNGEDMDKNAPESDISESDMTDDELTDKVDELEEKLDTLSEKLDEDWRMIVLDGELQ